MTILRSVDIPLTHYGLKEPWNKKEKKSKDRRTYYLSDGLICNYVYDTRNNNYDWQIS